MLGHKVYLVRHGSTEWNELGRYQGHSDIPLSPRGKKEARKLACLLSNAPLKIVYSSDLLRASQTAAEIALSHGVPHIIRSELREMHYGHWEGLREFEVQKAYADEYSAYRQSALFGAVHGGESLAAVYQRVLSFWLSVQDSAGDVCIVGHNGSLRALLCILLGLGPACCRKFTFSSASVTTVVLGPDGGQLTRLNVTEHLKERD